MRSSARLFRVKVQGVHQAQARGGDDWTGEAGHGVSISGMKKPSKDGLDEVWFLWRCLLPQVIHSEAWLNRWMKNNSIGRASARYSNLYLAD